METSRRKFIANASMSALGVLAASTALGTIIPEESKAEDKSGNIEPRRLAIVTGAARGIGRAISVTLAKNGIDIFGIDLLGEVSPRVAYKYSTEADILETKKIVEAHGVKFSFAKADTRNLAELKKIAEQLKSSHGYIDIIVADAGIQEFSPIIDATTEHWIDMLHGNVLGTAHTLTAFLPLMIPKKSGKVVVVSSTQGRRGMWNGAAYSSSKWALIGLVKSASIEMGPHHINVNAVVPGLIDTPMTRNQKRWQVAMGPGYENKEISEELVSKTLAGKDPLGLPWLTPEQVAPVVGFLTSPGADAITGAVYDAAGGTSTMYTS
jgi:NAD(P)-dependent dehydrogenase (short-subunit alcohol dehydrogenase family)